MTNGEAWIACPSAAVAFSAIAGWAINWKISIKALPVSAAVFLVLVGISAAKGRPLGIAPFIYCDAMVVLSIMLVLLKRFLASPEYLTADDASRSEIIQKNGKRSALLGLGIGMAILIIGMIV